jgi:hypothetical protein
MMKKSMFLAAAGLLAMGAAHADTTNLVSNGSFESNLISAGTYTVLNGNGLTGWTAGANGVELRNAIEGTALHGVNYVELDVTNNSSISQNLGSYVGMVNLTFSFSDRLGVAAASNGLSVSLGNFSESFAGGYNATSDNLWQTISRTFYLDGTNNTLTFAALGNSDSYGSSLDKISVTAVPEPETYAMFLAGLAALGFVARRRKQA